MARLSRQIVVLVDDDTADRIDALQRIMGRGAGASRGMVVREIIRYGLPTLEQVQRLVAHQQPTQA